MINPTDAVIAVTWHCNARCVMCNIWRADAEAARELWPGAYRRLPGSLRDINVTGGEPFLRDDLEDVVAAMAEAAPRARMVISTNGLLTRKIRRAVRRMEQAVPRLGLAVSLDGLGDMHDRMRGVDGAYKRARRTVDVLLRDGFDNIRLAFTATQENVKHLSRVFDLSRELGVEFTAAVAHASEHYFHTSETGHAVSPGLLQREVDYVVERQLRELSPKCWARAYFLHAMAGYNAGLGRPLPCRAGRDVFFLTPEGDVYPCNALDAVMGNVEEEAFGRIWQSEQAAKVRRRVAACDNGCWMVCSARTPMRRRWPRVLAWCLKRKLCGPKS